MSVSTAIIANLVLDAVALAALAYVCRTPFRIGLERVQRRSAAPQRQRELERRAA